MIIKKRISQQYSISYSCFRDNDAFWNFKTNTFDHCLNPAEEDIRKAYKKYKHHFADAQTTEKVIEKYKDYFGKKLARCQGWNDRMDSGVSFFIHPDWNNNLKECRKEHDSKNRIQHGKDQYENLIYRIEHAKKMVHKKITFDYYTAELLCSIVCQAVNGYESDKLMAKLLMEKVKYLLNH